MYKEIYCKTVVGNQVPKWRRNLNFPHFFMTEGKQNIRAYI